jgi:hypothetical protein
MNWRRSLVSAALLGAAGGAMALEVGEKPDTPQLPDSPYVVHDGTRPQPRKVVTAGAVSIAPPSDAKVLFDGTGTGAWEGDWKVENGILIASPGPRFATKDSFGSCQLHLEWRVPAGREVHGQSGGNSGVFLMGLYEVQVLESHTNQTYPDGQAGAMYGQYPPLVNASAPQGQWQSYDIIFEAPVYKDGKPVSPAFVTVLHNGVVLHHRQAYQGPTGHKRLAHYPPEHPATAPLVLQWHKDPIEYRNIWIRDLGEYDQAGD